MYRGKAIFPIALLAFHLCGCAATIHSFTDDSTKASIVRMGGNRLAGGLWRLELDAQRHEKGGRVSYSLFVVYCGPGFITMEPGKSLVLTIDGRKAAIEGSGSARHREPIMPGLVEETSFYHDINRELIREIAYAHHITVEVRGMNSVLQRHFTERNFISFRSFYEDIASKDAHSDSLPYEGAQRIVH